MKDDSLFWVIGISLLVLLAFSIGSISKSRDVQKQCRLAGNFILFATVYECSVRDKRNELQRQP